MATPYKTKPRWTLKQTEYLADNAYILKDEEMASALGKTLKSVRRKRQNLEIKKGFGRGLVIPPNYKEVPQSPSSPPNG